MLDCQGQQALKGHQAYLKPKQMWQQHPWKPTKSSRKLKTEIEGDIKNIVNRDRFGIEAPLTSGDFERQVRAAAKRLKQKTFKPKAQFEGPAGKKSHSV